MLIGFALRFAAFLYDASTFKMQFFYFNYPKNGKGFPIHCPIYDVW